jgi:hypothetical protein
MLVMMLMVDACNNVGAFMLLMLMFRMINNVSRSYTMSLNIVPEQLLLDDVGAIYDAML